MVIEPIEKAHKGLSLGELKRALFDAYPFGQRKWGPYKIWCQEQRLALLRHTQPPLEEQGELFTYKEQDQ